MGWSPQPYHNKIGGSLDGRKEDHSRAEKFRREVESKQSQMDQSLPFSNQFQKN